MAVFWRYYLSSHDKKNSDYNWWLYITNDFRWYHRVLDWYKVRTKYNTNSHLWWTKNNASFYQSFGSQVWINRQRVLMISSSCEWAFRTLLDCVSFFSLVLWIVNTPLCSSFCVTLWLHPRAMLSAFLYYSYLSRH